jgi:hypothetical protein
MSNQLPQQMRKNLALLSEADEALTIQVDVAALVATLRDNVDEAKAIKDDLEMMEEHFRAKAEPFLKAARSCKAERERMLGQIKEALLEQYGDRLPGNDWRMQLNSAAEVLELEGLPTRFDYDLYPNYVRLSFEWDKEQIEKDLKNGVNLPFARLKRSKALHFYLNTERTFNQKRLKETTK